MTKTQRRRIAVGVAAVVAVAAAAIAVVLVGSEESPSAPDPAADAPARPPVRPLGRGVRLKTRTTTIEVTPHRLVELPAHPGQRRVGVELSLRNVGAETYSDEPSQAASLVGAERIYEAVGDRCGGPSTDSIKLAPGEQERLCLAYQLGRRADAKRFVYSPEWALPAQDGAPETGVWAVG